MQKILKRFVLLFALVLSVVCCVAFVACDNSGGDNAGGDNGNKKITYTVTVTTEEDIDLTQISAQWKSGTEVVETKALNADGEASVQLEEGDYIVTLTGDVLYDYDVYPINRSVNSSNPDVEFTIMKKVIYKNVTVTVILTGGLELPSNLQVVLIPNEYDVFNVISSSHFNSSGIAYLYVPVDENEYKAKLANTPANSKYTPSAATVNKDTTELTFVLSPAED